MREEAPSLQQLIVNGWKNSSSAFFIIVQRDFYRGTALFRANAKYLSMLDEKSLKGKGWRNAKTFCYVDDNRSNLSIFIHTFFTPLPPSTLFPTFNKIDKTEIVKTSAISSTYPSIHCSKGRKKKERYLLLCGRYTHGKVKFHKGDGETSKRRRKSSCFPRLSKTGERGRSIGIHFAKVVENFRGRARRPSLRLCEPQSSANLEFARRDNDRIPFTPRTERSEKRNG